MDYQEAWNRLRDEISNLEQRGVSSIHPAIISAFMTFLEMLCDKENR